MNKRKKRTLKDIKERLRPEEIYHLIIMKTWPYANNQQFYHARDRALLALLYLTAGRISAVLRLVKAQFDFDADPDFIIIRNMIVIKRKKEHVRREGYPLRDVGLPRKGTLAPFTKLVETYLNMISHDDVLFPFGRKRAWQITNHITGKWNHYFRSQSESYYGRYVFRRDPIGLAEYIGIKNIQTLKEYVKTTWEDYRDQLLR